MFTIQLGSIDEPIYYTSLEEEDLIILEGEIDNMNLPNQLKLISDCDLYDVKLFSANEIRILRLTLEDTDIITNVDSDIAAILIDLKKIFTLADNDKLKVYGVGD